MNELNEDNLLIICPNEEKMRILDLISQNKKLYDIKGEKMIELCSLKKYFLKNQLNNQFGYKNHAAAAHRNPAQAKPEICEHNPRNKGGKPRQGTARSL